MVLIMKYSSLVKTLVTVGDKFGRQKLWSRFQHFGFTQLHFIAKSFICTFGTDGESPSQSVVKHSGASNV